jgi:Neuraminidase (sialidase)
MSGIVFSIVSLALAIMAFSQSDAAESVQTEPARSRIVESTIWDVNEKGIAAYFVYGLAQSTNNSLLAFSEGRIGSWHDEAPHHLVLKRSTDQGATWSDTIYIEQADGISLLYSDDNGQTWKSGPFLGDELNVTESRMVELDNGAIDLNARTTTEQRGKRAVAIGSNVETPPRFQTVSP